MPSIVEVYPTNGSSLATQYGTYASMQYIADVTGFYNLSLKIIRPSDSAVLWSTTRTLNHTGSSTAKWLDVDVTGVTLPVGTYWWQGQITSAPATVTGTNPKTNTVTVTSVPTVTTTSPANNAAIPWVPAAATSIPVTFTWTTSAVQTEYSVIVLRVSDSAAVASTVQTSSAKTATLSIPAAFKDQALKADVRIRDQNLIQSTQNVNVTFFQVNTTPVVTITAPTEGQSLTVGTPSVSFTFTLPSGQTAVSATASLYENGTTLVWSNTRTTTLVTTGTTISDSNFTLKNNTNYTYRVTVTDSRGGVSDVAVRNFSTAYTVPATAPAITLSSTNYTELGYNHLTWSGASPDADFYAWEVWRKDDLLDPDTGSVVTTGTYQLVGAKYTNDASNAYSDFMAPSGYRVTYQIRQVAFKFNSMVYGGFATSATADISTTYYWLVAGTNGNIATVSTFKMYHVTDDSFTIERERSEFILIGRGRYVENGTKLGVRGQLTCKLRNQGGVTARAKRVALETFQDTYNICSMRNPFGDAYQISLQDLSIGRLSGVGRSEFCDVTVPYLQVTNR